MIPDDSVPGEDLLAHTARLEAALERIAAASARTSARAAGAPESGMNVRALTDRLDTTIARLRAAIGES